MIKKTIISASTVLILFGCAAPDSFLRGKTLLESGKPEEGLAQVKQAMEARPGNPEIRSYYYRQRESWVNKLLRDADNARINSQWLQAEVTYKRVLELDESNSRALEGLKSIETGKQHEVMLNEASGLLEKDDISSALERVRKVLTADPANNNARILSSRIEKKSVSLLSPTLRLQAKFRKPVSLEFRDAPIKTVFEMLSKSAGVNFILDKDLRPDVRVSAFVKETSVEAAIHNIISTNQLGWKLLDESSVLVYPSSKKTDYEEVMVRTFYLNNVDAKQALELVKTVVKSKDVFIDDKLNILVIRDTTAAIRLAEKVIASYDLSDPEVVLEVEVLSISRSSLLELGAKFINQISVGVNGTPGAGQLNFDDFKNFTAEMGVVTINNPAFVLNLRATDGKSNILANPHIRVKNHKKAKIHIGDRVPVITTTSTSTGFASESINYLDVGLKLEVEPSVMISDEVSMDVALEVSNIVSQFTSKNGTVAFRLGTRNANTTLRLKNGETQMLAGLINDEESSTADRVPGISKLPLIGRLFSNNNNTRNKTEIVLLITPRIVRNLHPSEFGIAEFNVNTDDSLMATTVPNANHHAPAKTKSSETNVLEPSVTSTSMTGVEANDSVAPLLPIRPGLPPPPPLPETMSESQEPEFKNQ